MRGLFFCYTVNFSGAKAVYHVGGLSGINSACNVYVLL